MRVSPALLLSLFLAACGGDGAVDADPFDTFQMCFDEHHVTEAVSTTKSITICCLDHPIGSAAAGVVCGADATSCNTYVTANLTMTSATAGEITAGCTDYVTQKGM